MFNRSARFGRLAAVAAFVTIGAHAAFAGLPSDVILTADEQDGDSAIGLTVAKGNAELVAALRKIRGQADVIEVWGKRNQVMFKGRARVTVDNRRYESDTVICALDFYTCAAMETSAESAAVGTAVTTPQ